MHPALRWSLGSPCVTYPGVRPRALETTSSETRGLDLPATSKMVSFAAFWSQPKLVKIVTSVSVPRIIPWKGQERPRPHPSIGRLHRTTGQPCGSGITSRTQSRHSPWNRNDSWFAVEPVRTETLEIYIMVPLGRNKLQWNRRQLNSADAGRSRCARGGAGGVTCWRMLATPGGRPERERRPNETHRPAADHLPPAGDPTEVSRAGHPQRGG